MTRAEFVEAARQTETGAWIWKSNGGTPFDDLLEAVGVPAAEREATAVERARQTDEITAQYVAQRAKRGYSAEEMFEMRAAFGPGATVVDVLTGKTVRL